MQINEENHVRSNRKMTTLYSPTKQPNPEGKTAYPLFKQLVPQQGRAYAWQFCSKACRSHGHCASGYSTLYQP
jgi:hypothetical protein